MLLSRLHLPCLLVLLALICACSPEAPPVSEAGIVISDAWVNQPPPGATVAGAYLRLSNPGPNADRLLGVDTADAERVEIHEMRTVSGMMQMRELADGLPLPAGETTHLAPGGLHLMLIAPKVALTLGEEVTMHLTFEHAPAQTVVFQVRSLMDGRETSTNAHEGHHGHP